MSDTTQRSDADYDAMMDKANKILGAGLNQIAAELLKGDFEVSDLMDMAWSIDFAFDGDSLSFQWHAEDI